MDFKDSAHGIGLSGTQFSHRDCDTQVPSSLPVFMRPCLSSFPFRLPPVLYTRGRCPVSSPLSPSSLSPVGACPLCNLTHTSAFAVLVLHVTFQPRSAARDALMCGSSSLVDICTICVSAENHSHSCCLFALRLVSDLMQTQHDEGKARVHNLSNTE